MHIRIDQLYKRFQQQWVLRNIQYDFESSKIYGIAGPNGSGKSTLLQILAGLIPPSRGKVMYVNGNQILPEDLWFRELSYAAPYAEVYDYFTVGELLKHHKKFRKLNIDMNEEEFVDLCYLKGHEKKWIKSYSSGMKQRLRLALAILSRSRVLLLDEPLTNLDAKAIEWYRNLLAQHGLARTVIIASNEREDFENADGVLDLMHFQTKNSV
ncbi:MAG: ABC transporter ATP-binding protein [Saprospiraceae bacterium]|nr:ABC transporter ATP-binding protein [Saprospiraceae bacterium]